MPAADDRFHGILAPVITPFHEDLSPDPERLAHHCRWLLARQVGLALFGTNSEGNSLSVEEKIELLDRLVDAGIEARRMMPGTGCSALTDTIRLTRHAVDLGCRGVLMLPPFYYKGVSDHGLFASYSEIIERIGSDSLRIYLYHIPPVSQVGLSIDLVERLVAAWPDTIAGIKDSSGDWNNTRALLERGWERFRVFSGSESFLPRNLEAGGAGCISAAANVNPAAIVRLYREWQSPEAESLQRDVNDVRAILQKYPMIAALKAVVAGFRNDAGWATVRPPLVRLNEREKVALIAELRERGLDWPS
jgi:4-hydroxy-tetrahydrodipicolinate synthase